MRSTSDAFFSSEMCFKTARSEILNRLANSGIVIEEDWFIMSKITLFDLPIFIPELLS
jgi:hypothetical protein